MQAARHRVTGEVAAVKRSHERIDEKDRARILREVELLATVSHPRLVRFLGLFQDRAGQLALVYERVVGKALSETGVAGRARPEQVLGWVEDVAAALDALHGAGIVHRDVKPSNVMVEADGRARLLDFGLARQERGGTLTHTGILLGTPGFMPPEAFRGQRATAAGDRYALGCLAYWLIEGALPFPGETPGELIQALRAGPRALTRIQSRDAATRVARVLVRALAEDPGRRPPSGVDLARDLRAALSTASGPATSARTLVVGSPLAPPGPSTPHHRTPAAISSSRRRLRRGQDFMKLALAAGGLGLVLLGGLLVRGLVATAPEGPREDSPPALPPEAREPSVVLPAPFDRGYPARVRDELTEAAGRRLAVTGPDGRPRQVEVLDPDPRHWGRLQAELPELQVFLGWIRDGGKPGTLPADFVADLRVCDDWFRAQDLPRPFFPYLYLSPATEPVAPGPRTLEFLAGEVYGAPPPPPLAGWSGRVLAGVEALLERRAHEEHEYLVPSGEMPPELVALKQTVGVFKELHGFSRRAALQPEAAVLQARWLRAGIEQLQEILWAAGQAAVEEPETADLMSLLALRTLQQPGVPYHASHLSVLPATQVLGGAPAGYPAHALLRAVVRLQDTALDVLGDRQRSGWAQSLELFRQAAGVPGDGPWGRLRVRSAEMNVCFRHGDLGQSRELAECFQRVRPWLGEFSSGTMAGLSRRVIHAMYDARSTLGMDPALVRELVQPLLEGADEGSTALQAPGNEWLVHWDKAVLRALLEEGAR